MFSKVNLPQVNNQLEALGAEYSLLNPEVTRFEVLHAKTGSIIFEACHENTWSGEVSAELIELWFPGLYAAQTHSGRDWEHFWALDLKVDDILFKAGYKGKGDEDDYLEEEGDYLEEEGDYDESDDEKVVEEYDQIRLWEQQALWLQHHKELNKKETKPPTFDEQREEEELGEYWQTHKTNVKSDPRLENLRSAIKEGVFDDVEDAPPPQSPGLSSDLPVEEKKAILAWDHPVDYVSD